TAKEIPKLLKRFARYDPEGQNGGITLQQFLDIPEISTNQIMPEVASAYLERRSNKLTSKSFISILSRMSPHNSLDDKKQFAFQLLDSDNDGYLSYSELFSLFRMVTGPAMTDDHVLGIITSILSRSDLQQATRLTFEEFTNVVSDEEIEELFTVELQLQ
ncbi:hypothetical protein OS493_040414, partial [Desmophyllum pertusum]